MLPGLGFIGGASNVGGVSAFSLSVGNGFTDDSNLSTYSNTVSGLGPGASNRYIVVCAVGVDTTATTVSSATIGGISMTAVATQYSNPVHATILISDTPLTSGSNATLEVTFSNAQARASFMVYSLYGSLSSITPNDTIQATGSDPTGTIDFYANGAVIAATIMQSSSTVLTWTGVTDDNNYVILEGVSVANTAGSGSATPTSTTLNTTVTANYSAGSTAVLVAASWQN